MVNSVKRFKQLMILFLSVALATPYSYATPPRGPSNPKLPTENLQYSYTIVTNMEELKMVADATIRYAESSEAPSDLMFAHPEPLPLDSC